jgi:hypothetical protein
MASDRIRPRLGKAGQMAQEYAQLKLAPQAADKIWSSGVGVGALESFRQNLCHVAVAVQDGDDLQGLLFPGGTQ